MFLVQAARRDCLELAETAACTGDEAGPLTASLELGSFLSASMEGERFMYPFSPLIVQHMNSNWTVQTSVSPDGECVALSARFLCTERASA